MHFHHDIKLTVEKISLEKNTTALEHQRKLQILTLHKKRVSQAVLSVTGV